jgi:di/tricarboxylate transporter
MAVIMSVVALLSAFTHHLTTTAVMLPVTLTLARERDLPASKLLMPLSFAASLGTTITIIGAPAFLIASAALQQAGRPGLGIFSIAPIGLALSAVGTAFMLVVGRFLLPTRRGAEDEHNRFRLEDYLTELTLLPDSPLQGRTVDEVENDPHRPLRVVGLVRDGERRRRPAAGTRLEVDDVLIVRTSPEALVAVRQEPGVELHPVAQYQTDEKADADEKDLDERFVQAVVAPGAEIAGRTIAGIDFRRRYGAIVLGLWRRDGWLDQELAQTRLRPGDVLVLQGDDAALGRVEADPAFLMLVPFHSEARQRRRALVAAAVMAGTVALAAFNLLSIEVAAVAGAVAMVLTGCLSAPRAYRSIDTRIYVFIAGAIPLGTAMKATGASEIVAGGLQSAVQGWSQTMVLAAVFAVVAIITQLMSDSATTALFAPVAVALAQGLGHPPEPYVVTVAMAAVASFLTPIGHHGNLLVYTPGGYRFRDFVVVGAPLTVVVGVVVGLLAPRVFGAE